MNKASLEFIKLSMAIQDTTQSTKELTELYKSIQSRYHPIVWFIITSLWSKNDKN